MGVSRIPPGNEPCVRYEPRRASDDGRIRRARRDATTRRTARPRATALIERAKKKENTDLNEESLRSRPSQLTQQPEEAVRRLVPRDSGVVSRSTADGFEREDDRSLSKEPQAKK